MASQCRACLEFFTTKGNTFEDTISKEITILRFVEFICATKLIKADHLPWALCGKCYEIIMQTYQFIMKVKENEMKFGQEFRVLRYSKNTGLSVFTETKENVNKVNSINSIPIGVNKTDDTLNTNCLNTTQKMKKNCTHVCLICKLSFRTSIMRKKHEKKEHSPSHQCIICKKVFKLRQSLRVHSMLHRRKDPVSCDICHRFYRDTQLLSRHIRTTHSDESHECEACGATFHHKTRLRMHIRCIHPELMNGFDGHLNSYSCTVCPAVFKRPHHLKRHEKLHDKQRPYLCNICGKGFSQSQYLKTHLLEHSGGPRSVCKVPDCNKVFSQPSSLKRHMLSHQGARDWLCSSCGARFITSVALRKHQTTPNSCLVDLPPPKPRTILPLIKRSSVNLKTVKADSEIGCIIHDQNTEQMEMIPDGNVPVGNAAKDKNKLNAGNQSVTPGSSIKITICEDCKTPLLPKLWMSNVPDTDISICSNCHNRRELGSKTTEMTKKPTVKNLLPTSTLNKNNQRTIILSSIRDIEDQQSMENRYIKTTDNLSVLNQNILPSDVTDSSVWLNSFVPVNNAETVLYIIKDELLSGNNFVLADHAAP